MDDFKQTELTYPWSIRAPIAMISCLATMLVSYIYVEIISIHETLSKHFMARAMMSTQEFESYFDLMISFQSFTSIFGSLCLGYLADKFGYRSILILNSLLISSAQLLIELGFIHLNLRYVILGRVLLTLTYGSLGLPIGRILKKYFGPDNKFTLFNALVGACSILGCLLNSLLSSNLTNIFGVIKASMIPLLLAFICTLCLIILAMVDKKYYSSTEQIQNHLNKNFCYYSNKIYPQLYLLIAMIIQNALIGIFSMIGSKFINQFWGTKDSYFSHQTHDDYLSGIFWTVTLIILIPTGVYISNKSIDNITVLVGATFLQSIGFTVILFVNPFISMPILATGLAVRWAVTNPIFIDKFQQDFGIIYGFFISASAFVMFSMSLISEQIFNQEGSYKYSFLVFLGFQIMATLIILRYKRWQMSTIETESDTFNV